MQSNQINDMFEDAHIHIDNILTLLINRGLVDNDSKTEFVQQFDAQKQSGLVQIKLKPIPDNTPLNIVSKAHYGIVNRYCYNIKGSIDNRVSYSAANPLFLYIFPFINKTVNPQFKKIVET